MNRAKRTTLKTAISQLDAALSIVEDVRDEEEADMENLPENLHESEKYSAMEDVINSLEEAIGSIEDARDSLDEAIA